MECGLTSDRQNRLALVPELNPLNTRMPKNTDNVRRTTVLCDNDVGLRIDAIGETSPAPLGNCRRARDGAIAFRGPSRGKGIVSRSQRFDYATNQSRLPTATFEMHLFIIL